MHPDYTIRLDQVPSVLRTTPEAVTDLVGRGDINVRVDTDSGIEYCSHRQLSSTFGHDALPIEDFAREKGVSVEQAESLLRLGVIHGHKPFEPFDTRTFVRRNEVGHEQVAEALPVTEVEIENHRKQLLAERKANAARAKAESERSATSKLAEQLGVDEDLLVAALTEMSV
jgi:hypothetical protein